VQPRILADALPFAVDTVPGADLILRQLESVRQPRPGHKSMNKTTGVLCRRPSLLERSLAALRSAGINVLVILCVLGGCAPSEKPVSLVISTGTVGGTYVTVGEQLARILGAYPRMAISRIESRPSAGSIENIDRLISGEADLALVVGPVMASHPQVEQVRAVMALYGDVWQVVVRKDASVRDLEDLRGKRIFVGADRSGTKWGATRVLRVGAGLSEADYHRVNVHSYSAAARELESGRAQAAFFITATPATAISEVLASGCCRLLDLQEHVEPLAASIPGLSLRHIPPHIYENQPDAVHTLGSNAIHNDHHQRHLAG
jgi:TRAP transporter TAXI family solute receptor